MSKGGTAKVKLKPGDERTVTVGDKNRCIAGRILSREELYNRVIRACVSVCVRETEEAEKEPR
jgi:hypothetical protein